jgi:hypothetical protein
MKQILGAACVESIVVPHIYDDFGPTDNLYGMGFSYTKILPAAMKPHPYSVEEIETKQYDLIVYGSLHRGLPHWDLVTSLYGPDEVIALCGEDLHEPCHCAGAEIATKCSLFVRELTPQFYDIAQTQPNKTLVKPERRAFPIPGAQFIR